MNAAEWLSRQATEDPQLTVVGAPIGRASISPSRAWTTPPALREALRRFSTWDGDREVDVATLVTRDLGDVRGDEADADCRAAHLRIEEAVAAARASGGGGVIAIVGGDNSLTLPALLGLSRGDGGPSAGWGLCTLDAHHDVRPRGPDGLPRNGTPVRDLIEAGLSGRRMAQLGLQGFANAEEHARWAQAQGILAVRVRELRQRGVAACVGDALDRVADAGAERIYADLDIDVLDRAFAPACPASMPGGLHPAELQEAAFRLGADPRVVAVDITEVDAAADIAGATVRAAASVLLAFCAGLATRVGAGG